MKMRRALALLISAVMVLAMIPVVTLSTGAVDIPGDWDTFRDPTDYDKTEGFCPAAGYTYTADGFTIVPADYTDITPYLSIQSKEKVNIKDGLYLEFRVDDYSYEASDHWISFTLWDTVNARPGNDKHGKGWLNLNRTPGEGGAGSCQSFKENVAVHYGDVTITPTLDADGREIYTLEVEWDGFAYNIKVCGVTVAGSKDGVTDYLESIDSNGEFYVGIHMHSGVKSGVAAGTITKFGTSADEATVPMGSDSKSPENNENEVADFEDCAPPEAGKPALLWDGSKSGMSDDPTGSALEISMKGDLSYHFKMKGQVGFMTWPVKQSLSYRAEEYPILAIMFRDFMHDGGGIYWYTGDVLNADNDHTKSWSAYGDGFGGEYSYVYGEDDEYTLVILDMAAANGWEGRINGLRLDFSSSFWEDQDGEWDICYMGFFDTVDNAKTYGDNYMGESPATGDEESDAADDEVTTDASAPDVSAPEETTLGDATSDESAPEEPTSNATNPGESEPDESTSNVTNPGESTPEESASPESGTGADNNESQSAADDSGKNDGGCGSVVATGAAVAVLVAAAAAVVLKKKD